MKPEGPRPGRRRRLRVRWKEWKHCPTRRRNLRAMGIPEREAGGWAASRKGYWRVARSWVLARALPNAYWRELGLQGSAIPTAVSGMRREPPGGDPHAGWCGRGGGEPRPYPI